MTVYTYTETYTRAEAVVDQVAVLYSEAGVAEANINKVCHGVAQRWLEAVGLYLERDQKRVYEVEAEIRWSAYSDNAHLEFSTDLPGWEGTGSPEAIILGRRFAAVAQAQRLPPRYWVRFSSAIRGDPERHRRLCPEVGVVFDSLVPDWLGAPRTRSLPMQDLCEIGLSERSVL